MPRYSGRSRNPARDPSLRRLQRGRIRHLCPVDRSFEEPALQGLIERRPSRRLISIFLNVAREAVDLGVQVIKAVEEYCFRRHGQLRAAEFVSAVMTEDHVLESEQQLGRKWLAGQVGHLGG